MIIGEVVTKTIIYFEFMTTSGGSRKFTIDNPISLNLDTEQMQAYIEGFARAVLYGAAESVPQDITQTISTDIRAVDARNLAKYAVKEITNTQKVTETAIISS